MGVGRKPKPTALRVLQGNPGKRAINRDEPKPDAVIPKVPDHVIGEGRKEWFRISKQLHALGLLTEVDRAALAAYCVAYGRWAEAEQNIQKYGVVLISGENSWPVQSPYLSIANRAMEQMVKMLGEFGMSPSSRARVTPTKPAEAVDEMEDILSGRRSG